MSITLFHGWAGLAVALLGCFGLLALADEAREWLRGQFVVSWSPLRVHRRWDRPGVMALVGDGREVTIRWLARDKDAGDMVSVQAYGEDGQELWPPEWVSLTCLSPVPAHVAEEAS
jgi:hypothetical protein